VPDHPIVVLRRNSPMAVRVPYSRHKYPELLLHIMRRYIVRYVGGVATAGQFLNVADGVSAEIPDADGAAAVVDRRCQEMLARARTNGHIR
jgi:hypothetical protein